MKTVFSYKRFEISIVKGFVFGVGFDREYALFIGPIVFTLLQKPPVRTGPVHMNQL